MPSPRILTSSFAVLAALAAPSASAQSAPLSIADSLIEIRSAVSVFVTYRLTLFRADGTYQDIVSEGNPNQSIGIQTFAPASGTYTYTTIPYAPGYQGTIIFTSGPAQETITIGYGAFFSEGYPSVAIYPHAALTGAVNVSNNSWISAAHPTLPGFVIQGDNPRWVLIRGDGPSLAQFGVPSPLANPVVSLSSATASFSSINVQFVLDASGSPVSETFRPWGSDPNVAPGLQAIFSLAGAFQFPAGSTDCAGLVLLPPGAYVLQGSTPGADGQLLTEVYVLPYGN
jgi:hypothetical protein